MAPVQLTPAQADRAVGVLLGTAAGDALGAGYEFGPPMPASAPVEMKGGGNFGWAPGEWTDDTSMAVAVAEVAGSGIDLREEEAQDAIVVRWLMWAAHAKDIGIQTAAVFAAAKQAAKEGGEPFPKARHMRAAAAEHHRRKGRSGGNGSLMRTAPVALAYLDDPDALVQAATAVSALTHFDPDAGEACALWCLAIRSAVLTGNPDPAVGLPALPPDRRGVWVERLAAAAADGPSHFDRNGWVVQALQGAASAIRWTPVPRFNPRSETFRADHLRHCLEAAVRGGGDTDTVAAIAGGLLGGAYGGSAVPGAWRRALHGWPGYRTVHLDALAMEIATGQGPFEGDYSDWPGDTSALARHPYDEGMWLGGIGALRNLPRGVDAVVSLCRVRPEDAPAGVDWTQVRLLDGGGRETNPNLDFVLVDTVRLLHALRGEGRTVLLHCVDGSSRTAAVAALYGAELSLMTTAAALVEIGKVLPHVRLAHDFGKALDRIRPAFG
jgi:ADP-ribosyl-[dinitrogen reductase] hydrolase